MEQTITLQILAQDLKEGNYYTSAECPITKALHRAGFPNLRDVGVCIKDSKTGSIYYYTLKQKKEFVYKVVGMSYKQEELMQESIKVGIVALEPEDFTYTLTLDI